MRWGARAAQPQVSRGHSRHLAPHDAGRGAAATTWLYSRETKWWVWHSFVRPSVEAKFVEMIVTYRKPKIAFSLILAVFTFTVNTTSSTRSTSTLFQVGFVLGSLLYGLGALVFVSQLVVHSRRNDGGIARAAGDHGRRRSRREDAVVGSADDRASGALSVADFCLPYLSPQTEETVTVALIYGPLFVAMVATCLTKMWCYVDAGPLRDAYCYRSWYVESINLGALMLAITAAPVRSQFVTIISCFIWMAFVVVPLLLPRETFHVARYVSASLIGACEIVLCMATAAMRDHSFRETFTVGELLREQLEEMQRVKKQLHAVALKRLPEHVVVSVARRGYFHRASKGGFVVAFGPVGLHKAVRHDCAAGLLALVSAVSRHVERAMQPLVECGGATKFLTWGDAFAYCVVPLPRETRRLASELRAAISRATERPVDMGVAAGSSGGSWAASGSAVRTHTSPLPGAVQPPPQPHGRHSGSGNSNESGPRSATAVGDYVAAIQTVASVSHGPVELKFVAALRSVVATGDAVAECLNPLYLALAADVRSRHCRDDDAALPGRRVDSHSRSRSVASSVGSAGAAPLFPSADAVLLTKSAAKLLRPADEERRPAGGRSRVATILDEPTSRSSSDVFDPIVDVPVDAAPPHLADAVNPCAPPLVNVDAATALACGAPAANQNRDDPPPPSPTTTTEPGTQSDVLLATRMSWTGLRYVRPEMEAAFHRHTAASTAHMIRVHAWFMLSFCFFLYITAALFDVASWAALMPLPYIAFASVVAVLFQFTVWVTYTLPLATQTSRPGDSLVLPCCGGRRSGSGCCGCDWYSMLVPAASLGYSLGGSTHHLTEASADRVPWGFLDALYWLFMMSVSAAAMTVSSGLYPVGGVLIGPVSLVCLTLLTNRPQWGTATLLWTVDATAALWVCVYGFVLSNTEARAIGFAMIYVGCGAAAATLSARVLLDQRAREKFSQEQQLRLAKDEVLAMTQRLRRTLAQVMTDRDVEKFLRIQQNAAAAAAREGGAESRHQPHKGAMTSLPSRDGVAGGRGTLAKALVPARGGDPRVPGEANTSTEVKTATEDRAYAILLLQADGLDDGSGSSSSGGGGDGSGGRGTLYPVGGAASAVDVVTAVLRVTAASLPVFVRIHDSFVSLVVDVVDPTSSAASSLGSLVDLVHRVSCALPVAVCAWVGMTPMVGALVGTHSPSFDWYAPELITARTSLLTGPSAPRASALNANLRWGRTLLTSRAAYHLLVQLDLAAAEALGGQRRNRETWRRTASLPRAGAAAPSWCVGSHLRCCTRLTGPVSLHLVEPRQDSSEREQPAVADASEETRREPQPDHRSRR